MKKTLKIVLALGCLGFTLAGVACTDSKLESYQKEGYTVSVTYDGNGGSFLSLSNVTLMDLFKPADYADTKDADGNIHIKLTEPTDPSRPTSGDAITLTKTNHFFAGWYQNREILTVDGSPVDVNGRELELQANGTYIYADLQAGETAESITPAYKYSGYWDFEEDTLEYNESEGIKNITLYAGWVPHYEFHYYYQEDGEWVRMDQTTTFDYKTVSTNAAFADQNTIWVPQWSDSGAMNYAFNYQNGVEYSFPQIEGTTFVAAYTDAACTNQITDKLVHQGTLDYETCTAVNRVQKIYVQLAEGEQYRISNAQQLADAANPDGYYEIQADLDFAEVTWPAALSTGEFTGKMYSKAGETFALKNITVLHKSPTSTIGGIFGSIASGAEIKNLKFENAVFDLVYAGERLRDTSYGLFAGIIEEGAVLENVSVGGTFKIGAITLGDGARFNLYANGDSSKLTKETVDLIIYGTDLGESGVLYTVLPHAVDDPTTQTVFVNATYDITVTFDTGAKFKNQYYQINYTEVNQDE